MGGRGKHCFSLNQFYSNKKHPEAEFLNVIGAKAWKDFLLAIHSHFYERILLPPPALSKLVCIVTLYMEITGLGTLKIVPRNLNEIVFSWI